MKPRDPADPCVEKMKEEVAEIALRCRLQLNAFLDYGFTQEESFELLKLVTIPPIETGFALSDLTDRIPTV